MSLHILWMNPQGLTVMRDGLLRLSLKRENFSQVAVGIYRKGIDLEGLQVMVHRFAGFPLTAQSYSQIIELFPSGGGGYLVASKLLSPSVGMVSGCALMIDYVLTITLSIASGADAIFSFLPPAWLPDWAQEMWKR
jgi:hypothetical protein